jgi:hypothetical protein
MPPGAPLYGDTAAVSPEIRATTFLSAFIGVYRRLNNAFKKRPEPSNRCFCMRKHETATSSSVSLKNPII